MTEEQLLSWKETFYEVTLVVHCSILENPHVEELYPELIDAVKRLGSSWLSQECMTITDNFEEQYKDEDWIDLDWYDTVYEFTTNYLKTL